MYALSRHHADVKDSLYPLFLSRRKISHMFDIKTSFRRQTSCAVVCMPVYASKERTICDF